jgi:hypothetical protein
MHVRRALIDICDVKNELTFNMGHIPRRDHFNIPIVWFKIWRVARKSM